jgi:hypothetical protein
MTTELKIIFLGLCCFIENGLAPRTVAVIDVSTPSRVHGHPIQIHDAFIRIPKDFVIADGTNWPWRERDGDYLFALDHRELSLEGLPAAPPLHVDETYRCLVPRLTSECPDLGPLKPLKQIVDTAAAVLDLRYGNLSAFVDGEAGPSSTIFTHPTEGNVTIRGKRTGHSVLTIVIKPGTEMMIVNQPRDKEIVPDHFLAYYQLAASDNCCSNVPFREPHPGCEGVKSPKSPLSKGDPDVMSTVACSNSNYP